MTASARDGIAELDRAERIFNALAHETRRQILYVIHLRGGSMKAGDIANRFGCAWPTTTRHLRQLEEAGLVTVQKQGRERLYLLNKEVLAHVVGGWLNNFNGEAA